MSMNHFVKLSCRKVIRISKINLAPLLKTHLQRLHAANCTSAVYRCRRIRLCKQTADCQCIHMINERIVQISSKINNLILGAQYIGSFSAKSKRSRGGTILQQPVSCDFLARQSWLTGTRWSFERKSDMS